MPSPDAHTTNTAIDRLRNVAGALNSEGVRYEDCLVYFHVDKINVMLRAYYGRTVDAQIRTCIDTNADASMLFAPRDAFGKAMREIALAKLKALYPAVAS